MPLFDDAFDEFRDMTGFDLRDADGYKFDLAMDGIIEGLDYDAVAAYAGPDASFENADEAKTAAEHGVSTEGVQILADSPCRGTETLAEGDIIGFGGTTALREMLENGVPVETVREIVDAAKDDPDVASRIDRIADEILKEDGDEKYLGKDEVKVPIDWESLAEGIEAATGIEVDMEALDVPENSVWGFLSGWVEGAIENEYGDFSWTDPGHDNLLESGHKIQVFKDSDGYTVRETDNSEGRSSYEDTRFESLGEAVRYAADAIEETLCDTYDIDMPDGLHLYNEYAIDRYEDEHDDRTDDEKNDDFIQGRIETAREDIEQDLDEDGISLYPGPEGLHMLEIDEFDEDHYAVSDITIDMDGNETGRETEEYGTREEAMDSIADKIESDMRGALEDGADDVDAEENDMEQQADENDADFDEDDEDPID